MSLVGIDVGTTGCKAVCFDTNGHSLAYAYTEYGRRNSSNICEIIPEEIFSAVLSVLARLVAQCRPQDIKAIAVSSFGESFVAVSRLGQAIHNAILLTDPRGREECEELITRLGADRIMASTGVKPHPMYSASKLMWLMRRKPDEFKKLWRVFLIEDYVLWKLGAEPCIDPAVASRTMLFDVIQKRWDAGLLDAVGINQAVLSTPVPPGAVVGRLSSSVSSLTGLPGQALLVMGSHDQICACVGSASGLPGKAVYGMGTSECVTPVFGRPVMDQGFLENNYACVPHAVGGYYATYAFNTSGGSLISWFKGNFAKHLERAAGGPGESVYQILERGAAVRPSPVMVLPHIAGTGTPDLDPLARGAILGLSLDSSLEDIYRAVLEGVAFEMRYNLEHLERFGVSVSELRAVGGGARSRLWLQIKATVLGCKIVTLDLDEAGAAGAAIFAGIAAGEYASANEAAVLFAREKETFVPEHALRAHYNERYNHYKAMRALLLDKQGFGC